MKIYLYLCKIMKKLIDKDIVDIYYFDINMMIKYQNNDIIGKTHMMKEMIIDKIQSIKEYIIQKKSKVCIINLIENDYGLILKEFMSL